MSDASMVFAGSVLASIGFATSAFAQGSATKDNPADETAIRSVMADYNAALNGGETAAVLPLYADDGIFMRPYSPSAVGKQAVRVAYEGVQRTEIRRQIHRY